MSKKRPGRRILSIILAASMVVSSTLPAMANEDGVEVSESDSGGINFAGGESGESGDNGGAEQPEEDTSEYTGREESPEAEGTEDTGNNNASDNASDSEESSNLEEDTADGTTSPDSEQEDGDEDNREPDKNEGENPDENQDATEESEESEEEEDNVGTSDVGSEDASGKTELEEESGSDTSESEDPDEPEENESEGAEGSEEEVSDSGTKPGGDIPEAEPVLDEETLKPEEEKETRDPEDFYGEPESEYGKPVMMNEYGATYLVEEDTGEDEGGNPINSYVTVIGGPESWYVNAEGEIEETDNSLIPADEKEESGKPAEADIDTERNKEDKKPATSSTAARKAARALKRTENDKYYTNTAGAADVRIPERMSTAKGYVISDGENTVEISPTSGDWSRSVTEDNMIRYSDVYENVDIQYTVRGDSVKEDIILLEPGEKESFSYKLESETGLKFRKRGDSVIAYDGKADNVKFRIEAPVMIDAIGETSDDIEIKYNNSTKILTFIPDEEWLTDEEREYPVRIDPDTTLVGPEAFTVTMIAMGDRLDENGVPLSQDNPDPAIYGGNFGDQHTMVGYSEDYGYCRAMIDISTDWESLVGDPRIQPDDGGPGIKAIDFSIGIKTEDTPNRTPFTIYRLNRDWNKDTITWKEMDASGLNSTATILPDIQFSYTQEGEAAPRLSFDITDTYAGWLEDPATRHGLMMAVEAESPYIEGDITSVYWAETFYSAYGGTDGPRIELAWEGNLPGDLETLEVEESTLEIDPGVIITEALEKVDGRSSVGVLAHGITQAGAEVEYSYVEANTDDEAISGEVTAEGDYIYPDFSVIDDDCFFPINQDSNWQSEGEESGTDLETDTIYKVEAIFTGHNIEEDPDNPGEYIQGEEEVTFETESEDTFLLYEVQASDLIEKIANHYGVKANDIRDDNRIPDQLTVAGDILFIRNPKTDEPYTSKLGIDTLQDYLRECLLLGEDPRCYFDMEPVNTANGSFYMEQTDVEIEDLGGSFSISRSYNSLTPYFRSEFGTGWNGLLGEKIMIPQKGMVLYTSEDGKGIVFEETGDGDYKAPTGYDYELSFIADVTGNEENTRNVNSAKLSTPSTAFKALSEGEPDTPMADSIFTEPAWELTELGGNITRFNIFGQIIEKETLKGYVTEYAYNADANLSSITSPTGKVYEITTTLEGLITEIELPNGGVLKYEYDGEDNLISFTNAEGETRRYEYDSDHRMTAWYDELGNRITENVYDSQGRVSAQTDALGSTAHFSYVDGLTTLTDNNGNVKKLTQDDLGRNIKVEYANGDTETTAYDEDNRISQKTDANGVTTAYTYDENGNILTETRSNGQRSITATYTWSELDQPLTVTDPAGNITSYTYDDIGNLLTATNGEGNTTSYTYDEENRIETVTDAEGNTCSFTWAGAVPETFTDGEGYTYSYTYDEMNNLLTETDPEGNVKLYTYNLDSWNLTETAGDGGMTVYEYDPSGNVISITDSEGAVSEFRYDAMHNITSGTDALGGKLTYEYDRNYNKIKETDAEGNTTAYTYDVRNRVVSATDAKGNTIVYALDGAGNIISTTDRRGFTESYAYDAVLNLPLSYIDAEGNTFTYEYDGNGNTTAVHNPDGSSHLYSYDGAGRVSGITAPNGLVTLIGYDGNGNIVSVSDGEDRVYAYAYDGRNLLEKATDPLGGVARYTYDKAGRNIRITDENGNPETYGYDGAGRLTEIKNALNGVYRTAYDLNGLSLSETDENGNTTAYERDILGRTVKITDAEGNITALVYDSIGNLTGMTDAMGGETAYSYDPLSQPVKMTDPAGREFLYEYDNNGNILKATLPDGDTVSYTYDKNNRVHSSTDEAGVVTLYTYDSMGRVTRTEDTAGNIAVYTYDISGNRITSTDTIGRVTHYSYDDFGRLVKVTAADGAETGYAYDALDRLIKVIQPDGTEYTYGYDPVGNLTELTEPGEAVYRYAYDEINRVTSETDPLGAVTAYEYDGVGNLLKATDGEGNANSYVYDKIYRLLTFKDGRGNDTVYEYDPLSRLLSITTPEGGNESYTYDVVGNILTATDANGLVTSYEHDIMGNIIKIVSPKGAVNTYTYDKHDELTSETDAMGNVVTYDVDMNRLVTKITQKNGGEYKYTYDPVHRLTSVTTPLGYKTDFSYSAGDNILKLTDNMDRTEEYTYDIMHRMISATNAEGGLNHYTYDVRGNRDSYTNSLGYTRTYNYDLVNQMTASTDPEGKATEFVYNLAHQIESITKPGERTTSFIYDGNYNITALTDPKGYVYGYDYDKDNREIGTTDPLMQRTYIAYDAGGRVTSVTDKMSYVTSYVYDGHGNITDITAKDGLKTSYSYDILDRLTGVTLPSGLETSYGYDVMGNVISVTDTMGRTSNYTYDIENNLTSVTDAMGRKEEMSYDIAGRLLSYTSNGGNKISYDYDKINDLVSKEYSKDGEKSAEGVLYGYDTEGQRLSMMDTSGESTYKYDSLGRIIEVTDGSGETVKYAYDGADRLESITYPDGKKASYLYDKNDNLTTVTDRTGAVTTYVYDEINRITEIHRPNGISSFFTYNPNDQITYMKNVCDECDWVVSEYSYEYDAKGFIIAEDAVESLYGYAYDDKHSGKHENGRHDDYYPHGGQHRNKHDKDGLYNYQIVETNRTFTYDEDGKLTGAVEDEERAGKTEYTFRYDDMGNRTYYERKVNGKVAESTEISYNEANQMTEAREYDGKHYRTVVYEYDDDGNLITESEKKDGTLKTEKTYTYEVENRLKAVYDTHDVLMAAAYDGDGNRIFQLNYNLHTDDDWKGNSGNGNGNNKDNKGEGNSGKEKSLLDIIVDFFTGGDEEETEAENIGATVISGTPATVMSNDKLNDNGNNGNNGDGGNGNHYGWESGNGEVSTPSEPEDPDDSGDNKDNNGNAQGNTNNTGGSENQSGILFPETGEVSDLEQELIDLIRTTGKEKDYELIQYVNDVNREYTEVLMELNINGEPDTAYSYGNERLTVERFDGWTGYYTYDGRGSVSGVTGSDGEIWASYRYNAYGEMTFGKPQYNNVYGYNGENYNPNLDGLYLRARYYSVSTGNFFTEDSYLGDISNPLTLNRYNYVKSSPLNYIDPTGFESLVISGLQSEGYKYQFIETALHDIDVQKESGRNDITWLVFDNEEIYARADISHFKETAENIGVSVEFLNNKDDLINYINYKSLEDKRAEREYDKITRISVFSHGQTPRFTGGEENQISFGYELGNAADYNFTQSDIERLLNEAFDRTSTLFFSCNSGTADEEGKRFAQEWSNKTGGLSLGLQNARSNYSFINSTADPVPIAFDFPGNKMDKSLSDVLNGIADQLGLETSEDWREKQNRKEERQREDANGNIYGYSDKGSLKYPIESSLLGDADIVVGTLFEERGWVVYVPE